MLFFAFLPPPPVQGSLLQAWRAIGRAGCFSGRFQGVGRLHLSLQPVGNPLWPERATLDAAGRAAATLQAPSVALRLDRLMVFQVRRAERPLVATAAGEPINAFRQRLGQALEREGLVPGKRQFLGHVTLGWGRGELAERPLEDVGWLADELVLVRSHVGEGRHEHLGRWPLRA